MLLDISLNVYKSFIEVYKTGNISKAAKRLFISQPAVSMNIKTLENSIGQVLFIKSNGALKPTPQATILFNHLLNSFNELENAEHEILHNDTNRGVIKLGCQTHIFAAIIAEIISKFNKEFPNIKFEIISRSTNDMIQQLNNCDLDLMFDTSPILRPSNDIKIEKFLSVENVFFAKNFSSFPDKLKVEELNNYNLVTPILNSKTIDALLLKIGDIKLNPIINSTTSEAIVSLVKYGVGIGYVMKSFISNELKNNTLKVIEIVDAELPTTEINICYNTNNMNAIVKKFLNYLYDN